MFIRKRLVMKLERGMTLIEIMIVLALVAVLAMSVAPLTSDWLRQGDLTTATGNFHLAVGRAKSSALRNNMGATANAAVAAVCFANGVLTVEEGAPGAPATPPACDGSNEIWRARVAGVININAFGLGGAAMTRLCFDNKGLPTVVDCAGGATTHRFTITAGENHEEHVSI